MADPALQLAETIQTAHINPHPSPLHDLNPSTAASRKEPVRLASSSPEGGVRPADDEDLSEDEVPVSVLRPVRRKGTMPPLPDLRFEQSYLASIRGVEGWKGVAWVTVRDQVMLPLIQGTLWALILSGWRHFNRETKFNGRHVGARIRRWWWGVNNWPVPGGSKLRLADKQLAENVREYYEAEIGAD